MAKARLAVHQKIPLSDGRIIEVVVWELPEATHERPHGLKYSLFYGREGIREVGYDNERGKGDHRHYLDREERYDFVSIDRMLDDFFADIARRRSMK
jgi:Family of unknown function (DUF6516)